MHFQTIAGVAAATLALGLSAPAWAVERVKVGDLRCEVSAGLGLIITSTKEIDCAFTTPRGMTERYYGKIQKFGLDIGATNAGVLIWDVFSATEGPRHDALAGDYAGVDASATIGAGLGANALVGGSDRAFALQPLSVQGQTGLALAAGVESLTLRPER
jgi:hypothetical protein